MSSPLIRQHGAVLSAGPDAWEPLLLVPSTHAPKLTAEVRLVVLTQARRVRPTRVPTCQRDGAGERCIAMAGRRCQQFAIHSEDVRHIASDQVPCGLRHAPWPVADRTARSVGLLELPRRVRVNKRQWRLRSLAQPLVFTSERGGSQCHSIVQQPASSVANRYARETNARHAVPAPDVQCGCRGE